MVDQSQGRTFISYSRRDGAEYAAWLRNWLQERNLSVWQDLVTLEGGRDWWSQIEDALRSPQLQHFILVVTLAALASPVVRREIRLARQEGKTVCPVKGPGLKDLDGLPRWIGQVYDLDLIEHQTTLIRVVQDVGRQKRVPMMAPEPPEDFVARPREFDALKKRLLDAKGDAVAAITAALRGAGGYGKTTLAKALTHDPEIQDAYFDGILWVELGEKSERLLSILIDQIEVVTGERPGLETVNAAAGKLGEALGDRRILMIVDDAWREQDLLPFLQGGPNCVRLVTTRIDSILPQKALRQPLDAMQAGEALSLLSAGLPADQVALERATLVELAARLGEWAQLLKIVNGFLRDRVVKANESLAVAVAGANRRLGARGLVAFDPRDEADRTRAVARTIAVSLELLAETDRARFGEIGVFPEDAEIPVGVAALLWAANGGLEEFETEDLLGRLYDLSLLLDLDLGQRSFRLHDTVRHFLRDRAGKEGLVAHHKQLVAALDGVPSEETDARTRSYYYLHLPHHLAEAKERDRLDTLLLDPGWLKAKLEATANPQALVADYHRYGVGEAQSLIGRTLLLVGGICARDLRQLLPQLIGRLVGFEAIGASGFLENARWLVPRPGIVPSKPALTQPGAEAARLEGHTGGVNALCVLSDGRLASGSDDGTLRLWDVPTGAATASLKGHHGKVSSLCLLPDGRLASGSDDGTIQLWDVATADETVHLHGHTGSVNALCPLADGRLASGSDDGTIQLWDVATADETAHLHGHTGSVNALCPLADGRLASGSDDETIRLWDVATRAEAARLYGHMPRVDTNGHMPRLKAFCLLPDGCLASASDDGTIGLWDIATGAATAYFWWHEPVRALCLLNDGRLAYGSYGGAICSWEFATGGEWRVTRRSARAPTRATSARLEGHTGVVNALCLLPDGKLASGSIDGTIRLWDASVGAVATRLARHIHSVSALCLLNDGRLASASEGDTTWLWDVATGTKTTRVVGHARSVSALCLLKDGRLALGTYDNTIRLWDVATGGMTARILRHADPVIALCQLKDGRLASCSYKTIRLWDVATGAETARLEGHTGVVNALCMPSDGRLASGSDDGTIRLWDVATGAEAACLKGHYHRVSALCPLADGRLASGSADETIRLWDIASLAETARLNGHTRRISALCLLPDGRLASGSDDQTIRLWNVATGFEIARLELDPPVTALVAVAPHRIVGGDSAGSLHWLGVLD